MALNTNKADHHVILITDMQHLNDVGKHVVSYNRDIVESGIKYQEN